MKRLLANMAIGVDYSKEYYTTYISILCSVLHLIYERLVCYA